MIFAVNREMFAGCGADETTVLTDSATDRERDREMIIAIIVCTVRGRR